MCLFILQKHRFFDIFTSSYDGNVANCTTCVFEISFVCWQSGTVCYFGHGLVQKLNSICVQPILKYLKFWEWLGLLSEFIRYFLTMDHFGTRYGCLSDGLSTKALGSVRSVGSCACV